MEKVTDKGDEELYNKLDMAYASSDEETDVSTSNHSFFLMVFGYHRICV